MKPTDLIKELINAGCVLKRVRGSHHIFYSPITNKIFPVPHPKSNWPISPVKTIKKSAGLYNPPPFEVFFFTLGIQTPNDSDPAYGIVVPALCDDKYSCYSAADKESDIPAMATEAILLTVQDMIESDDYDVIDIHNDHVRIQITMSMLIAIRGSLLMLICHHLLVNKKDSILHCQIFLLIE